MKTPLMAALVAALSLAAHSANAQDYAGQRYLGFNIGKIKQDHCSVFHDFISGRSSAYDSVVTRTCPDKDTRIKLYVGHNLHKNFAVEAGYIDFGKFKSNYKSTAFAAEDFGIRYGLDPDAPIRHFDAGDIVDSSSASTTISGNSLFVAGIGKIQVHPKATLFGKVGLHRWDIAMEYEDRLAFVAAPADFGIDFRETFDDDGVDWFYGIGGIFALFPNEKIKLRMEYEMFTVEEPFGDTFDFIRLKRWDSGFEFISIGIVYAF